MGQQGVQLVNKMNVDAAFVGLVKMSNFMLHKFTDAKKWVCLYLIFIIKSDFAKIVKF